MNYLPFKERNMIKLKPAFLFLVLITFITGCQPTPEEPIVVAKNELEQKIEQSTSQPNQYSAPIQWEEQLALEKGVLNINAEINVPKVSSFPVVNIGKEKFSQEQADKMLNILTQGKPLYDMKRVKTKDDIQQEILAIQKNIADPKSDLNYFMNSNPNEYEKSLAESESQIKDLEKQLQDAPDSYERKLASLVFESGLEKMGVSEDARKNMPDFGLIEGEVDLGKSQPAYLKIMSSDTEFNNHLLFVNMNRNSEFIDQISEETDNLKSISMTKEEARGIAEETVQGFGLSNMKITAEGSDIVSNMASEESIDSESYKSWPQCYVFYFTRNLADVPVTFVSKYLWNSDSEQDNQYSEPWPEEFLKVCVDDQGVNYVEWNYPVNVMNNMTENVDLLPFDQIQDKFRQQIEIEGSWDNDPAIIQRKIYITKIVLGLAKIPKKDSPDECLLVPAWDFFGYSVNKYEGPQPGGYILDENNEYTEKAFAHSFLTLNAIDGSVINRELRQ